GLALAHLRDLLARHGTGPCQEESARAIPVRAPASGPAPGSAAWPAVVSPGTVIARYEAGTGVAVRLLVVSVSLRFWNCTVIGGLHAGWDAGGAAGGDARLAGR